MQKSLVSPDAPCLFIPIRSGAGQFPAKPDAYTNPNLAAHPYGLRHRKCLARIKRISGSKDTMRSSKSRSRSKTNRPRTLGNIINRVFDSSGPEGKVRGTPAQLIEKYQFLARDAQLSNDRVAAENFLQHAEHYTRLLAEANREIAADQDNRQPYQQPNAGGQNSGQNGQTSQNGQNNQNGQTSQNGQNQPRDRQQNDRQQNDRQDYREQRPDYRAEQRSDYRNDVPDEQPVITAHDLVDQVSYDDAGLVETPEAAPKPRTDEPRRNDRPRYDRTRDENRRSYPPRVEQPQGDRQADVKPQTEAKPQPEVKAEAAPPQPERTPPAEATRQPSARPVQPQRVQDQPAQKAQPSMMPQMPLFDAAPSPKPAPKPRAKPAAAQSATSEPITGEPVAAATPKPRLAPRPRAPKKPVDGDAVKTGPNEVTSD